MHPMNRSSDTREQTIVTLQRELATLHETGDHAGEAMTLVKLGRLYADLSEYPRAVEHYEQAVALYLKLGDTQSVIAGLRTLGRTHTFMRQRARAIETFERALALCREMGDSRYEASLLMEISSLLSKGGDRRQALRYADSAIKILEQLNDAESIDLRNRLALWRVQFTGYELLVSFPDRVRKLFSRDGISVV